MGIIKKALGLAVVAGAVGVASGKLNRRSIAKAKKAVKSAAKKAVKRTSKKR